MLSGDSLEVMFIVLIESKVLRKALRDPPGLLALLLLVLLSVIIRFRRVIIAGRVSVLRHGAHVCEERLSGTSVLMREVTQAARQVRWC